MLTTLMGRPSIRGWELRQGVESLVEQVCRSRKLYPPRVYWDGTITTAAVSADGLRMWLACPADDAIITRAVFVRYVGFVLHEVLHLVYTKGEPAMPGYLRSLWNGIEDAWIERRGIADRVAGNIAAVLSELLRQMAGEALAEVKDWADPKQYPFALAVYLRPHATLKVPLAAGLEPIFAEAGRRLEASTCSADNAAIAAWVLEQLNLPKQEDKPQDKPEQGQDKGDKGNPADQPGNEPGEAPGGAADKPSEGGEPGKPGAPADGGEDKPSDKPGNTPGEGSGKTSDKPGTPGDMRAPNVALPAREVEPTLGGIPSGVQGTYCKANSVSRPGVHTQNTSDKARVLPVGGRLRNELRRLFENTGTEAFQRNRKAGAINTASLHRIGTTERLFQRRQETEGVDSAVVLLLDISGSMRDRGSKVGRRSAAVSACVAIHEALTLAGCSVCVLTFNSTVSMSVPFGAPTVKARASLERVECFDGTNDSFAVRYGHEVLLHRKEARRVLMVLTDAGGQQDEVKVQIKAGEALGISTVGVGIQSDIAAVYKVGVNVWELEDLGRAALGQLKLAA